MQIILIKKFQLSSNNSLTFQLPEFLVQKFLEWPPPKYFRNVGLNHHPPPPPKMQIWTVLGTLGLSWSGPPPAPPPMQIWTDLGTLGLSWSDPPTPCKFGLILHFAFELVWSTPPPRQSFRELVCGD